MSVLARKRKLSRSEYAYNAAKVDEYNINRCSSVPKRMRSFICSNLLKLSGIASNHAITAYMMWERDKKSHIYDLSKELDKAISSYVKLQKSLLTFWVVRKVEQNSIRNWVSTINKEIILLNGAAGYKEGDRNVPMLRAYELAYNPDCMFVWNMEEIVREYYSSLVEVPIAYRDSLVGTVLRNISEAMFHVAEGNASAPLCKQQYYDRLKHFNDAIVCLNALQIPLLSIWVIMQYSDKKMVKMIEPIDEEIKMLNGVIKSDKERFGYLAE